VHRYSEEYHLLWLVQHETIDYNNDRSTVIFYSYYIFILSIIV